jgi:hypothetical protein
MMKILRRLALGLVVLVIIAAMGYRAYVQHRIAGETRITSPNGIDEAKYIDINGAKDGVPGYSTAKPQ